jgi:hypothetical protein
MSFEYALQAADQRDWRPEILKRELERRFPNLRPVARERFVMLASLANLVAANLKHTTIRYSRHEIEFPSDAKLPLFVVDSREHHDQARHSGDVRIGRVQYKQVGDLSEADAAADGFPSRDDLIAAMRSFYGPLKPNDYVSIYHFVPVTNGARLNTSRSRRTTPPSGAVSPKVRKALAT